MANMKGSARVSAQGGSVKILVYKKAIRNAQYGLSKLPASHVTFQVEDSLLPGNAAHISYILLLCFIATLLAQYTVCPGVQKHGKALRKHVNRQQS